MEHPRRRGGTGFNRSNLYKAVAAGVVTGLLISLAAFMHKSRLDALQEELGNEISFQANHCLSSTASWSLSPFCAGTDNHRSLAGNCSYRGAT